MEKIRRHIFAAVLAAAAISLYGCYRQTTVILSPGETLPTAATHPQQTQFDATTVPLEETAAASKTERPSASGNSEHSKPDTTNASQAQEPPETSVPAPTEAIVPTEVSIPVETTAPTESTAAATEPMVHPVYDISNHSIGSYEQSILDALNGYRADSGMPLLSIHKKLSALAAIRAYECSRDFSHTRPDGRSWDTVLSDYGASASTESILYASSGTSGALLIDTCIGSDSHRQKILNSNYNTVGIGIYHAGSYVFIVMIFR